MFRKLRMRKTTAVAASVVLAASALVAAPASAAKPPPPPSPDKWEGCTPWGPVIYGVDCCDYPELIVPCVEGQSPYEPARLRAEEPIESPGR